MASINLGLESLKPTQQGASESQLLVNYYAALNQFSDTVYEFKELCTTSESLRSIRSCIRQYGVTQSLESLFGENFSSAAAMEEEAAAAEQQIEAKKAGFFQRLIDLVKRLYNSLIALVKQGWTSITNAKFVAPFKFKQELIDSADKFEAKKKEFKRQIAEIDQEQKKLILDLKSVKSKPNSTVKNDEIAKIQREIEGYKEMVKEIKAEYHMLLSYAKIAARQQIQDELTKKNEK